MHTERQRDRGHPPSTTDLALRRIVAEIVDGLRHGYFEFGLTCEVIGGGRRRVVLHAGKTHQFLISAGDCEHVDRSDASRCGARAET